VLNTPVQVSISYDAMARRLVDVGVCSALILDTPTRPKQSPVMNRAHIAELLADHESWPAATTATPTTTHHQPERNHHR